MYLVEDSFLPALDFFNIWVTITLHIILWPLVPSPPKHFPLYISDHFFYLSGLVTNIHKRRINIANLLCHTEMPGPASWLHCSEYTIHPWAISGLESAITVRGQGIDVTFDMGYVTRESVNSENIFIR